MTWWRLCGGCGNLQLDITGEEGLWRRDGVGDAEMEGLNLITSLVLAHHTIETHKNDNCWNIILAKGNGCAQ